MVLFEVAIWILFGVTIGGMVAFFMEKRGHTAFHLAAGAGGGLVGGIFGWFLSSALPGLRWTVLDHYSITALICSLIFAGAFVGVERSLHRKGRHVILNDARADYP